VKWAGRVCRRYWGWNQKILLGVHGSRRTKALSAATILFLQCVQCLLLASQVRDLLVSRSQPYK
jgi:hypothetical protein